MSITAARHDRAGIGTSVPLAWRSLVANRRRLLRSSAGIGFAVLLMLMQLGFEQGFFASSLQVIRGLDGDIFLQSVHKYQFATQDPIPLALLATARRVPGVASARPLYADWSDLFWKNPIDGKVFLVRGLAFDPGQPVFLFADINAARERLASPGTILVDRRSRRFLGMDRGARRSQLNGTAVSIVGSFALGPDFQSDGTVVMSDRTFADMLRGVAGNPPGIAAGVIKLAAGADSARVQQALAKALPRDIAVMTKSQLLAFERAYQADVSSAGPIFAIGTIVGFVVGMLISYQVTYADIADQLAQYATLKAIGYPTRYLLRVVLGQAALNGFAGWLPAWLVGFALYWVIGKIALLPLRMTVAITLLSLGLTLGMCLISAVIAVRRVIKADPAEVF
ncbi:MAG TPA: FtsX-like permease family protein [Stellaceae bacterium]|nr:FtsX-like permease family protein [Stellaceae bacterium]